MKPAASFASLRPALAAPACALALTLLLSSPLGAATVTWVGGAGDPKWSSPANWSANAVPGSDDDIVIPNNAGEVQLDISITTAGQLRLGSFTGAGTPTLLVL